MEHKEQKSWKRSYAHNMQGNEARVTKNDQNLVLWGQNRDSRVAYKEILIP